VAYDPKAQYVGRIETVEEKNPVELETPPQEYAQFKHLFWPEALEKKTFKTDIGSCNRS